MKKRKIPQKNYIILLGVILLVICACYASFNLYQAYQDNRINKSPLATKELLYEDLQNAIADIDADTFLVISYVQDKKVYANEKQIKKSLMKRNLIDNVMYLDVTDYRTNKEFVKELNDTLKLKDKLKIKTFPALIYYKNNEPTKTVDSSNHLLNVDDFDQIIDMYELAS